MHIHVYTKLEPYLYGFIARACLIIDTQALSREGSECTKRVMIAVVWSGYVIQVVD